MPSAFTVGGSPITTAGTLAVTGAGTVGQYIRGDGSLADFPESSGGGSSVSYYLNGSVAQGTIGGVAYKELNKVPVLGAGTDFTINADGYIASFITDAGDPNLLEIPAGNWNFETYFSASSSGGTPSFYVELYKYDGSTFTLLASNSSFPEFIAFGTIITPYFSTLAVPTTTLALTDRLAIRYYVIHSGRTITLHTEDNHLCQIVTTFTTGLTALNGLTAQVQNFAVGTSGTDFNIASATATHTFNLPTASALNRGALSSADWSIFNGKQNALTNPVTGTGATNYLPKFTGASTVGNSIIFDDGTNVGIGTATPTSFGAGYTVASINGSSGGGVLDLMVNNTRFLTLAVDGSEPSISGRVSGLPIVFKTNNAGTVAERMRIFSDGNIFIGSSPSNAGYKLEVNGTGRFSDTISISKPTSVSLNVTTTASLGYGSIFLANGDGTTSGKFSYVSYYNAQTVPQEWRSGLNGSNDFNIRNNTAARNDLTITTSGNVGIGTASPAYQLTLNKASNPQLAFTTSDVLKAAITHVTSDNSLRINNNGADRLTITSGGNIGIGTAIAAYQLTLNKASNPQLAFTTGDVLKAAITHVTSDNSLRINNNGADRITITSTGNVLINTTTDNGARLQVSGTATVSGATSLISTTPTFNLTSTSASGYSEVYFYRNTNSLTAYISSGVNETVTASGDAFVFDNRISGGNMVFRTNGGSGATERMRITSSGNVLIGTTTDVSGANLNVNGNIRTAAPSGATASNFRVGTITNGALTTNASIRMDINGTPVNVLIAY